MITQSYGKIFSAVLILMLVIRISMLWLNIWPINGDEAQYWNWGQHLAWGYYSKPPMIAWVIALTTKLFGNGAVGLRLGSPLAYSITAMFIYLSGTRLFNSRVGFWSGIMFLLLPGVSYSSTLISTDPILLTFWSGAFYGLIRALEKNECEWWVFAGVMLGFAFYSKYAAVLFILSMVIFLIFSSEHRQLWKSCGPYVLVLQPILMLIPNIIWNSHHHFASVNAVADNADLSTSLFHPLNGLNFISSQLALFGPILFIVLLVFLFQIKQFIKNDHYKLLFIFTVVTLGIMTIESVLSRAHANWSAPAYVSATILVCAFLIERKRMLWLWLSLGLHSLVILGLFNVQFLVRSFGVSLDREMTIISWPVASKTITQLRSTYPTAKLLVDNRMLLTQIMYFADVPLQDTVRWNPTGQVMDQYDLVTSMQGQQGKNFLLFTYFKDPIRIENDFVRSTPLPTITLMTLDGQPRLLYVFYLEGFKGY